MRDSGQVTESTRAFSDPRAIDDALFGPLEAQQLHAQVFRRVFGDPNPVRIGRYTVLDRIGAGGMGVVYAAFDNQLDRKVAVKLMQRRGDTAQARTVREAKSLARLSHPNVVAVHDVGVWQGRMFIAMEFIDGQTFGDWLATAPRSAHDIVDLLSGAGQGLVAAHAAGIIHRDFKPDNVLVGSDGRARVVDFGVARSDEARDPESLDAAPDPNLDLTLTGTAVGTPAYMAPEQLTGAALDSRVDQFAFAIVLYEALAGQRPFAARDVEALRKEVCEGKVRALPRKKEIGARIRAVLARALRPDPADRYPSMAALLADLRPRRRPNGWLMLAAATLVAVVSGVAYSMVREATTGAEAADAERRQQSERADEAERAVQVREERLVVSEARALLATDPTGALDRLAELSPQGWVVDARAIAASAMALGTAREVAAGPTDIETWRLDARAGLFVRREDERRFVLIDPETGAESVFVSAMLRDGIFHQSAEALVSRDGTTVAACCNDGRLRIAQTTDVQHPLVVDVGSDSTGFVSAAGGAYVAVLTPTSATVYDIAKHEKVRTIPLTEDLKTKPSALSPAGDAIVAVDARGALMRWSADATHEIAASAFGDVRFSADGHSLAARLTKDTVAFWSGDDATPTEPAQVLENVGYFELAPLGGRVAYWRSGSKTGISVTDLSPEPEGRWFPTNTPPTSLMFSDDGRTLGAMVKGQANAWDLATGAHMEPRWPVETVGMHLTADSSSVVTLDRTGKRITWNLPWTRARFVNARNDERRQLAYRGDDLFCSDGPRISKWAASAGVLTEFARMSRNVELLVSDGDRLGAYDGETASIWEGDEQVVSRAVAQGHGRALDVTLERFTTSRDDGVVQTDLRTGDAVVALPLDWDRDRLPQIGFGRGITILTRSDLPLSWWRTDAPGDVRTLDLGDGRYRISNDGRALLRSNLAEGISTVYDLDGEAGISARGFERLVQLIDEDGTMVGRLQDGVGFWQPGMARPVPVLPGVANMQWVRPALAPDQREVALAEARGTVIRVRLPRILHDPDPAAVLATLRPHVIAAEAE